MNPLNKLREEIEKSFRECDTCSAKPGSPTLCSGCLHNRDLIISLHSRYLEVFRGMVEGMKVIEGIKSSWHRENAKGYNQALSDLSASLKEEK